MILYQISWSGASALLINFTGIREKMFRASGHLVERDKGVMANLIKL